MVTGLTTSTLTNRMAKRRCLPSAIPSDQCGRAVDNGEPIDARQAPPPTHPHAPSPSRVSATLTYQEGPARGRLFGPSGTNNNEPRPCLRTSCLRWPEPLGRECPVHLGASASCVSHVYSPGIDASTASRHASSLSAETSPLALDSPIRPSKPQLTVLLLISSCMNMAAKSFGIWGVVDHPFEVWSKPFRHPFHCNFCTTSPHSYMPSTRS
ncbi:hypothetical protein K431DRAFT_81014 [Polychaeton citri CBS 116435]|uniref:Uncharacterized protein n=1 Tax=Polychaeton citri CBS 116435 TaxID=1314669 RepID=A0A9P4QHF9_9PEZI|nr:hypothetical protein K431DRAFT_81014 [Polychaeton citri CBS 116435]